MPSTTTGRGCALVLDRGGLRRVWLRGRDNGHKRHLIHVAGDNLGLVMRLLAGAGTPRKLAAGGCACWLLVARPAAVVTAVLILGASDQTAMLVVSLEPEPPDDDTTSSTGC